MRKGDNVDKDQIELYINRFNKTLEDRAKKLPEEAVKGLKHLSLLPSRIICYISTQFGVAFEYISSDATSIETIVGSARVEDLIMRAPRKLAKSPPFIGVGAKCFGLIGTSLVGSFPFRLTKEDAYITITSAEFSAPAYAWSRNIDYAEVYGSRKMSEWTEEMAIERANDEVDAALFEFSRAKALKMPLSDYLNTAGKKLVIIFGSYDTDGLKRLRSIQEKLVELGYDAVLPMDCEIDTSLPRKVLMLGSLARFVIFDDTTKSGHIRELEMCKNNDFIMAILRRDGEASSQMTRDYTIGTSICKEFSYDLPLVGDTVIEAVSWAEEEKSKFDVQIRKLSEQT